ncbi:hypothetical protein ABZZ79_03075 [Streptomyces sp. NPDC006458]|uniref:hypothetical protein n=1 Tax=Streptomyces sp. NPDC006458 TaxID=3154302 RepID=UPI0033AB08D0
MSKFIYRNENTGDVVEYDYRSPRLEMLPNWVTLQEPSEAESPADTGQQEAPQVPGPDGRQAPADPGGGGDGNGPDAIERPARSASKSDWTAYARTRARDADEEAAIDGLTKEQLIEQFGGDS